MKKYFNLKLTGIFLILIFYTLSPVKVFAADEFFSSYNAFEAEEPCVQVLSEEETVYVGGLPFGVKFYTEGITVVGFSEVETDSEDKSPAYNAGLREYDVILSANSTPVSSAKDFIAITENSNGQPIAVDYKRMGEIRSTSFSPVLCKSDGKFKTGMWIKDSTAGIGTLTYIIPETKAFAGLGHSICDAHTGEILKLKNGIVTDVTISGIEKGTSGVPGELKGTFSGEKTGTLVTNCNEGIYGVFSEIPKGIGADCIVEVAKENEITEGEATIRCTLGEEGPCDYTVNITHIDLDEATNKNYVIEITDPRLIEKTGGIVQGMSGSPIIQSGKLIGAVTHVFISDPKKGYGISISNMIEGMPDMLK